MACSHNLWCLFGSTLQLTGECDEKIESKCKIDQKKGEKLQILHEHVSQAYHVYFVARTGSEGVTS